MNLDRIRGPKLCRDDNSHYTALAMAATGKTVAFLVGRGYPFEFKQLAQAAGLTIQVVPGNRELRFPHNNGRLLLCLESSISSLMGVEFDAVFVRDLAPNSSPSISEPAYRENVKARFNPHHKP